MSRVSKFGAGVVGHVDGHTLEKEAVDGAGIRAPV